MWQNSKPVFVVPSNWNLNCGFSMVPKSAVDEQLIALNKVKLELGSNIEISHQFVAGDGEKEITFAMYILNLKGETIVASEKLYTIKFNVIDDICTTYTIVSDSSGSTAGSTAKARQNVVVNVPYKLLLDNFSF